MSTSGTFLPSLWLPLMIFVAEVCVVTLSTMRIIFLSRGRRFLAPILGFFEIVIWLFAIGQIMRNLNSISCYFAFAGGFTMGNFLGIFLERILALGMVVIHIITGKDADALVARLQEAGFGVTTLNGHGSTGAVKMVFTILPRRQLPLVKAIIKEIDLKMFYSIDDIQSASEGIFPRSSSRSRFIPAGLPRFFRAA
jgi:uncharacterized protein YebE (UPF0316 family)